jgi:PIN domain nuclease of toxin-antitoxin system
MSLPSLLTEAGTAGENWHALRTLGNQPISVWETLVLAERGRLVLEPDPVSWVRHELVRLPFRHASLTHEVAVQSRLIDLPHGDPADRFLAATARVYGCASSRAAKFSGVYRLNHGRCGAGL